MTLLEHMITWGIFFGVTFVAAAINSVAGGGTFLTFPVFILNGLSPLQANIMSTIALWPGTLASAYGYRGQMVADRKTLTPFLIIGVVGGALGALLLLLTPEVTFAALVPWLLLAATLIFTFGRQGIALMQRVFPQKKQRTGTGMALQFFIAIYGGYFGAGIGILLLAMLQILGHSNIHRMNALKTVLGAAINAVTALIFVFSGKVLWSMAAVMVAGGVAGGYVGARLALKVAPEKVRMLVSAIGFAMTAYFFLPGK
jgi:uncharacterized protein